MSAPRHLPKVTKTFRVKAYADNATEAVVHLSHGQFQAVAGLLEQLNNAAKNTYGPTFTMYEVAHDGTELRAVIPL
ncbi:hypothetical protein [Leifsonia aquatica]|uniref:hypothetical protein n=1 Tax=Leifsonia aquatica TaxID=144185 RepID=UPI0037F5AB1A